MITRDNLSESLNAISKEDIKETFESTKDYVLFCNYVFNVGTISNLSACDYCETTEQRAQNEGQIFCDKDTFLQLFKDSESVNPYLIELI